MKAILLAAGLGTRLKPLTEHTPKCLVPIAGKPLLSYWLEIMEKLGIDEVLINVHYLHKQVEEFITNYSFNGTVRIVYEDQLLGTAGTLIYNKDFWYNDQLFVAHADNFCLANLETMLSYHNKNDDCDITLLAFETTKPKECGVLEISESNIITAFHEKVDNPPSCLASGALAIFNCGVYKKYFSQYESDFNGLDLSRDILPDMVGSMRAWEANGLYIDIGSSDTYKFVNDYMEST